MSLSRMFNVAVVLLVTAGFTGCFRNSASFETIVRSGPKTHCFYTESGRIWIGTAEGLLSVSDDGKDRKFYGEEAGFKGRGLNITGIIPDGRNLLVATSAGIAQFSPASEKVTRIWTSKDGLGNDSIRELFRRNRELWAATIFGASVYDPATGRWRNYSEAQGLPRQHVYTFALDKGTLYASSMNGGLVRFDPALDRFREIPRDKGLGNTHIYDIEPSPDGLWLATAAGVNFYSTKDRKWDERICTDGFTDYTVYAIKLTGDILWFGTSFGLFRRDLNSGRQVVYDCGDGLPGAEVVGLEIVDKALWVCTREGIARFKGNP